MNQKLALQLEEVEAVVAPDWKDIAIGVAIGVGIGVALT